MSYARSSQSAIDLKHIIYQKDIFLNIDEDNFSWFEEIGFTRYTPAEMKMFSRNPKFYKIEDDYIFLVLLRPQDVQETRYYLREKTKITKTDEIINQLKNNEDIYANKDCIQSSNDIKNPSLILYRESQYDFIYYDENRNTKQVSYYLNVDRVNLKINSDSNFYLSVVNFENKQIKYIEVMIDGVIKSGEPLKSIWNELSVLTPTIEELFNYEKELTEEIKFLFAAVDI